MPGALLPNESSSPSPPTPPHPAAEALNILRILTSHHPAYADDFNLIKEYILHQHRVTEQISIRARAIAESLLNLRNTLLDDASVLRIEIRNLVHRRSELLDDNLTLELQNRKLATENEGLVERVAALEHKVKLLQMEKEQMAEKLEDGKKEKAELERHQDDLEKDMKFLECEIEDLRI